MLLASTALYRLLLEAMWIDANDRNMHEIQAQSFYLLLYVRVFPKFHTGIVV